MGDGAQYGPVMGGAELTALKPDRTVAQGEDCTFSVEDDGGDLGVKRGGLYAGPLSPKAAPGSDGKHRISRESATAA